MSTNVLNYSDQLLQSISSMFLKEERSDVSLRVKDKDGNNETLPAHELILFATNNDSIIHLLTTDVLKILAPAEKEHSETVNDLPSSTQQQPSGAGRREILVKVWSLKGFKLLLKFIYSGKLEFDDNL